ncbi:MAG: 2,3-bisphosphoglycerate-independent phosphoglycerate mutase [Bacteriovoracaceae bacterium]|jgi:2,3-bisphosphoglycerate-independent phosphoglycerate mutase|nr:2,3-bisphosphoglycerate-independent phosphoglycerate mutase [Bacteriovoracaceae bacterium]
MSDTTLLKAISKKALLIILDGFGHSANVDKNAILDANTPNIDQLFKSYPFCTVEPGGTSVGLPKGVAGNSEVGHMNLGAGRPVRQDLVRINEAIEKNQFGKREEFCKLVNHAKSSGGRIHLMGLLSDGGVHSHIEHLKEIIRLLNLEEGIEVFFHAFMDGRDTHRTSGIKYIKQLINSDLKFHFASIQGRSIGMDRDRRWEKIQSAYEMMTGATANTEKNPVDYIQGEYDSDNSDEFITPALFNSEYAIKREDSLFFINFRPDRAIQISLAFNDPKFNEFAVPVKPSYFLCMTPYCPEDVVLPILFDKEKIEGTLSEYLSKSGLKQFKIAETEKFAHITFFLNGGEKAAFEGEHRVLVPSPKEVATYDLKPEMSAHIVTEKLSSALNENKWDFYLVNYANSDMVGHTGNYDAAVKAIETLDGCVKKLIDICQKQDITVMLTADHGNADQMVYPDGSPHTSHSGAPVPFCVIHPKLKNCKLNTLAENPALKDVAPTLLHAMGLKSPEGFSGESIFQ